MTPLGIVVVQAGEGPGAGTASYFSRRSANMNSTGLAILPSFRSYARCHERLHGTERPRQRIDAVLVNRPMPVASVSNCLRRRVCTACVRLSTWHGLLPQRVRPQLSRGPFLPTDRDAESDCHIDGDRYGSPVRKRGTERWRAGGKG